MKKITFAFVLLASYLFAGDLHQAVRVGDLKTVKKFIEEGVPVDKPDARLNSTIKDETPLMIACEKGNVEIVRYLISKGANVNAKDSLGGTPIILATVKGHVEIVKILISKGADVNAVDIDGNSALWCAAEFDYPEIYKLLKEAVAKD